MKLVEWWREDWENDNIGKNIKKTKYFDTTTNYVYEVRSTNKDNKCIYENRYAQSAHSTQYPDYPKNIWWKKCKANGWRRKNCKPSADPKISVLISILETRHLFPVGTINCSWANKIQHTRRKCTRSNFCCCCCCFERNHRNLTTTVIVNTNNQTHSEGRWRN